MKFAILIFLLLLAPWFSWGQEKSSKRDVQELLGHCRAGLGKTEYIRCLYYVSGVVDMMGLNRIASNATDSQEARIALKLLSFCGDPTYGAAVQAFINWAERNPDKWDYAQLMGVHSALSELWPCSPK